MPLSTGSKRMSSRIYVSTGVGPYVSRLMARWRRRAVARHESPLLSIFFLTSPRPHDWEPFVKDPRYRRGIIYVPNGRIDGKTAKGTYYAFTVICVHFPLFSSSSYFSFSDTFHVPCFFFLVLFLFFLAFSFLVIIIICLLFFFVLFSNPLQTSKVTY